MTLTPEKLAQKAKIQATIQARQGKLKPDTATSPTHASSSTSRIRLFKLNMNEAVEKLKRAALYASEREVSVGRYQDDDIKDIPRNPSKDDQWFWDKDFDKIDARRGGEPILGDEQALMLYFITPIDVSNGQYFSVFNKKPITWHHDEQSPNARSLQLPFYDNEKTQLPVGVRAGDCYLGACWMSTKSNLHCYFSTDIHPDGFPFPDRMGCGPAFMPRAHIRDFPTPKPSHASYDRRIGYIRCPDGKLVFLGGYDFNVSKVTNDQWANFHHHFIDVSKGPQATLRPVAEEPAEIARRHLAEPDFLIRPTGAVGSFELARRALTDDNPGLDLDTVFGRITLENRRLLLNNLPVRGYDPKTPTFELLSLAMLAGHLQYGATEAVEMQYANNKIARIGIMKEVDILLNDLDSSPKSSARMAQQALLLRNSLAEHFNSDEAFGMELAAALSDIPSAGEVLKSLPRSIITPNNRELANIAAKVILSTDGHMAPTIYRFKNREAGIHFWTDEFKTPPAIRAFRAPFKSRKGDKRTDGELMCLLTPSTSTPATVPVENADTIGESPIKQEESVVHSPANLLDSRLDEPPLPAPSKRKHNVVEQSDEEEDIPAKKRTKAITPKVMMVAMPEAAAPKAAVPKTVTLKTEASSSSSTLDQFYPAGQKWVYSTPVRGDPTKHLHKAMNDLGYMPAKRHPNPIHIAALEAYVNKKGKGSSPGGQKYGKMVQVIN